MQISINHLPILYLSLLQSSGSRRQTNRSITPSQGGKNPYDEVETSLPAWHNDYYDEPARQKAGSRRSSSKRSEGSGAGHDDEPTESEGTLEDEVDELPDIPSEGFMPFVEFPTPELLREANQEFTALHSGKYPQKDGDGKWVPYPTPTVKEEVFLPDQYANIDTHAVEVHAFDIHNY